MKTRLLLIALLASFSVVGQGWEQTYYSGQSSIAFEIDKTSDGGYVIFGSSSLIINEAVYYYPYVLKINSNGVEEWSQIYEDTTIETNNSGSIHQSPVGQQTSDGGYVVFGTAITPPEPDVNDDEDFYILKIDQNGSEQWSQTFGGYEYNNISMSGQQTSDGGYIICGNSDNAVTSGIEIHIIKTDSNGQEQWSQTYSSAYDCYAFSIEQTSDNGFIITGAKSGYEEYDLFLLKVNSNGEEEWFHTYGDGDNNSFYGYMVQQTADGGYIIVGETYAQTTVVGDENDVALLLKTDANGQEQWRQVYGGIDDPYDDDEAVGYAVDQTLDGGYIILGFTEDWDMGSESFYLIKTDQDGEEQWSQTYAEAQNSRGFSVKQTNDGGYVIAGSINFDYNLDYSEIYVAKIDSEGTLSSEFTIPTPTPKKLEKVVDALGREVNQTTNQILFHIYDDGSVEKKFIVE